MEIKFVNWHNVHNRKNKKSHKKMVRLDVLSFFRFVDTKDKESRYDIVIMGLGISLHLKRENGNE